jgi:hypothetical protein
MDFGTPRGSRAQSPDVSNCCEEADTHTGSPLMTRGERTCYRRGPNPPSRNP